MLSTPTNLFSPHPFVPLIAPTALVDVSQAFAAITPALVATEYEPAFGYLI